MDGDMIKRVSLACAVLLTVTGVARSQDCKNPQNPENQLEMNFCAAEAFRRADDSLQSLNQEIRVRVTADPMFRAMLESSHSSWVAYRDAQCLFVLGPDAAGSSEPWARFTCMERLTQLRLEEMRALLECEEGSFLCRVPPVKQ